MQKDSLRKQFAQIRSEAHAKLRYDDKQKIFSHLRQIPSFVRSKTIMCYFARGSEVPTKNLILELLNSNKKVVLPKTNVEDKTITPYLIESLEDLESSSFGVLEPKLSCKICKIPKIDSILVPAVAFDLNCHRLGYGLGFYDRFLSTVSCDTIGLAYDATILNVSLPIEPHDVALNFVVSERRVIKGSKQ